MKKNCLDLLILFSVKRLSWNLLMLATLMLKVASYVHFCMTYENIANYFPRLIQGETLSNHWLINSLLSMYRKLYCITTFWTCCMIPTYFVYRISSCIWKKLFPPAHGSYKWIIMHEKCGPPDINGFQLKWRFGTHGIWKN